VCFEEKLTPPYVLCSVGKCVIHESAKCERRMGKGRTNGRYEKKGGGKQDGRERRGEESRTDGREGREGKRHRGWKTTAVFIPAMRSEQRESV